MAFHCVGLNRRSVTFGALTGAGVKLNIQSLYRKQIKVIRYNGRLEKSSMMLLICLKNSKSEFGRDLTLKMQKKFLQALFAKERDGK